MPFHHCLEQMICLYLHRGCRMNLLNMYQTFVLILHEIIYWKWCAFRSWAARCSLIGNFNYPKLINTEHSVCAFCSEHPLFCVYAKHVSSMILYWDEKGRSCAQGCGNTWLHRTIPFYSVFRAVLFKGVSIYCCVAWQQVDKTGQRGWNIWYVS